MVRTKQSKKIIALVFLITLSASLFTHLIPPEEEGVFNFLSPLLPEPVSASEEESIDSFDVHPESFRWNTTRDDAIEDRVIDSQFEILTVENTTDGSGSKGYEMNRGTVKADGKLEWRMNSEGSGNQTSYFRDYVGDECDFTEGDQEGSIGNELDNDDVSNGIFSGTSDAVENLIDLFQFSININPVIYHSARIRFKFDIPDLETGQTYRILLRVNNSVGDLRTVLFITYFTPNNEWQDQTIELTDDDWDEEESITAVWVSSITDSGHHLTDFFSIDLFEIIGDFDFATHLDDQIADTWDWEDSNEFWFTDKDNISDFNDGSEEVWEDNTGGFMNLTTVDGWLEVVPIIAPAIGLKIKCAGQAIPAVTYDWFTFELYVENGTVDALLLEDLIGNQIYLNNDDVAEGATVLYSCDLDADADWAGVEDGIQITVQFKAVLMSNQANFNFTFLYDTELGDPEGADDAQIQGEYPIFYVNPNGYWTGRLDTQSDITFHNVFTLNNLNIDPSLFHSVVIRWAGNEPDLEWKMRATVDGLTKSVKDSKDNPGFTDLDSFVISTFDLSSDSDWSSGSLVSRFWFDLTEIGDFEGDEILIVDYVLLLGEYKEVDTVIGLMDSVGTPLLNISTHFYGNNTNRLEFELLDDQGELSYYWYSDLYNDLDGQFLFGKCEFDVLKSKLEITITNENNTRIDKITFPNEFSEGSVLTPALFSNEIAPYVFVSTHITDHSWSKVFIDWIKIDFKEREWTQFSAPADGDWLNDRWDLAFVQDDVNDDSLWYLTVPYLDSVSASMHFTYTNTTTGLDDGDIVAMQYDIAAIDSDDGEQHSLITIYMIQIRGDIAAGPDWSTLIRILEDGIIVQEYQTFNHVYPLDEWPQVSFSMSTTEERTSLGFKARVWLDKQQEDNFSDYVAQVDLADIADLPSQEFIMSVGYSCLLTADNEWIAVVEDFGFVSKDIFSDIGAAIVEPLGNFFQNIFTSLFKFIAGIFRAVGDIIVLGVGISIAAVTAAVNQIQTWLTTLGTTIGTAINQIEGWLTTIAATISTAIDQIEGWLNTIASTISTAIDQIDGWLTAVGTAITDALADIAADIWTAFGTAAADIMDDIVSALTGLASDFADFVDAVMAFLIPLLVALAEDLANLIMDILDFVIPAFLTLLGTLIESLIGLLTDAVFWLWDALALPDFLAVLDVFMVGLVQLITGLPTLVNDIVALLVTLASLFVIIGFFYIFILPIAISGSAGQCIEKIIDHSATDLTGGASFLGIRIPVPIVIPWLVLVVGSIIVDTALMGFFV